MAELQEIAEMTDTEIRLRYGKLVTTASKAFSVDPSYSADIVKKAKQILARKERKPT
jgi:hypothetical protein